jgi:hypothetical protein
MPLGLGLFSADFGRFDFTKRQSLVESLSSSDPFPDSGSECLFLFEMIVLLLCVMTLPAIHFDFALIFHNLMPMLFVLCPVIYCDGSRLRDARSYRSDVCDELLIAQELELRSRATAVLHRVGTFGSDSRNPVADK